MGIKGGEEVQAEGICNIFNKTDHILGHKASLSKYKKIEIIP
jgi:hypothetical protein